jgi:auxin influx carrier (AUX1 LAX family)
MGVEENGSAAALGTNGNHALEHEVVLGGSEGLPTNHEGGGTHHKEGATTEQITDLNGGGGEVTKSSWFKASLLWKGSSTFDSFLLAQAAQAGQGLLTLPSTFAELGFTYGAFFMLLYGVLGAWSVYILTWLYFEFKARMPIENKGHSGRFTFQYHDVIGGLTGRWGNYFTRFFVMSSLFVASVIQLIASASELYYANDNLDKRQWTYVVGALALISVFIPSFGHFRWGAILGVFSATFTAIYLFAAAISHGQIERVSYKRPDDKVVFFAGATYMLYVYGGHGVTIEIMESTRRPHRFKYVYIFVVLYTWLISYPSAIAPYWAFGETIIRQSNAFGILPSSPWRMTAIVLMVMHQSVSFIIFVHPIFLLVEKFARVHHRSMLLRILVRIPVVVLVWFVALAIPFFGPINSVMGAFLLTVVVYMLPLATFMYAYRTKAARQNSVLQLPPFLPSWTLMFLFNGIIVLYILVVGAGFGGWASIANLIRQIHTFGFFSKCYQCPPKA